MSCNCTKDKRSEPENPQIHLSNMYLGIQYTIMRRAPQELHYNVNIEAILTVGCEIPATSLTLLKFELSLK